MSVRSRPNILPTDSLDNAAQPRVVLTSTGVYSFEPVGVLPYGTIVKPTQQQAQQRLMSKNRELMETLQRAKAAKDGHAREIERLIVEKRSLEDLLQIERNLVQELRMQSGAKADDFRLSVQMIAAPVMQMDDSTMFDDASSVSSSSKKEKSLVVLKSQDEYALYACVDVVDGVDPNVLTNVPFSLKIDKTGSNSWMFGSHLVITPDETTMPTVEQKSPSVVFIALMNLTNDLVPVEPSKSVSIDGRPARRYCVKVGTLKALEVSDPRKPELTADKKMLHMHTQCFVPGFSTSDELVVFTPFDTFPLPEKGAVGAIVQATSNETNKDQRNRRLTQGSPVIYHNELLEELQQVETELSTFLERAARLTSR
jgi:cell division protein FtsL